MRPVVMAALLASLPTLLGAQAAVLAPTDSVIEQGRRIFEGRGLCASCHGMRGEGLLGPTTRLAGRPFVHTDGSHDALVAMIRAGIAADKSKSGNVMPPKGGSRLTDSELDRVARYVAHLSSSKPKG